MFWFRICGGVILAGGVELHVINLQVKLWNSVSLYQEHSV